MKREKEILRAYQEQKTRLGNQEHTFMRGAKWADAHPRWISVEDELPKKDGRYLFYDEFLGPRVSAYYVECTLVKEITHWMPLPQAPKKGGEE